jgi:hypothetical protein
LLIFGSGESLKHLVGDLTLDEALEHIGFADMSSLFEIVVNHERVDFVFPGWFSIGDSRSTMTLIQANE